MWIGYACAGYHRFVEQFYGFKLFENTFDYSFDSEPDFFIRLQKITSQISEIEKGRKKILSHGNLNSIRSFLDLHDAMEAYWVTAKKGKVGEIYNIGANESISIKKVLETLIKKSRVKIS